MQAAPAPLDPAPGHVPDIGQGHGMPPAGPPAPENEEWAFREPKAILEELEVEYKEADASAARDALDKAGKLPLEDTIEQFQKELDALLIYSGLLATVLAPLNVEAYRLLRPDTTQLSTLALRELSAQLRFFASNNQSDAAQIPPPFVVGADRATRLPLYIVWLNCLWFTSLIISLSSATITLLVKQWLYESLSQTGFSNQARVSTELLQYRMDSLNKWRVRPIALLVPFLLQLALLVFFAGLLILMWNLNATVAAVSTVFIVALATFSFVMTLLPAIYGDCCYRSPQAFAMYATIRPFRNFVREVTRWIARKMSKYTSAKYFVGDLVKLVQLPCVLLSRAPRYLPWWEQEQAHLRVLSHELDVKTAVTAWSTTLDPVYLDYMRVALSREPNAPLVECLYYLGLVEDDTADLPMVLTKRNARQRLARMVLVALRQMLTIQRRDRAGGPWEETIQRLLNLYARTSRQSLGSRFPHDEQTLRTAFFILMEAKSPDNQYAALDFLSTAVNVDSSVPCDYLTVSRVLSAVEQWTARMLAENEEARRAFPENHLVAFSIVAHCMLRVVEGKPAVPPPQQARFEKLHVRVRTMLSHLPDFLPTGQALLDGRDGDPVLCNHVAFGLQVLLPLLTRLSRCQKTASDGLPVPELVAVDVAEALWSVWETARTVLDPPDPPPLDPLPVNQGSATGRLEILQASVASFFPQLSPPLRPPRDPE